MGGGGGIDFGKQRRYKVLVTDETRMLKMPFYVQWLAINISINLEIKKENRFFSIHKIFYTKLFSC